MNLTKKEKVEMRGFETRMNEMGRNVGNCVERMVVKARLAVDRVFLAGMRKEEGIDGILVTVGLCIIALLLCVVMKDSLKTFIETIVASLTSEAKEVLSGVTP